ncbi:UTP--glucose-1-phosphate uridylyltransferase GalU [Tengunoibacter tsumagoiensis]|uniref:UTP--glucose-1-phosphate uridylyltransferase n=1 Tax=Tengunoibacter tsumagoiensis TaxID=2014871 RepID=A0A401ZVC5_9CHLR|nr:UTP--glucose-1-phosphate uridylyltransferase GalU [Tengunoibacter tsumagoiensis]GCE10797.1 UTP--glucose-1-phosphate uridylyltransferase [Tengunoibacter tsumagoiensis]
MHIRKAVMPVAGLGTRVLPATKVVPKELLPIVDKPTLQYIVEEAVTAGIEEIIFVTSRSKRAIEDHFDAFPELEQALEHKGKKKELEALQQLQQAAKYISVRQVEPLGLGHAVLCAKELVGNEPFVVMLGDEIFAPETPPLARMLEVFEEQQKTVLSLFSVPREQIPSYGIASVEDKGAGILQVQGLVEKPPIEEAPSDLAVAGRYILTPDIFAIIEKLEPGRGGEIQLTDALQVQAQAGNCYGIHFKGQRYDMGNPLGLLTTSIAWGLRRPELAPALRDYMRQVLKED